MKKPLFLALYGVLFFAAGYGAREWMGEDPAGQRSKGRITGGAAGSGPGSAGGAGVVAPGKAASAEGARAFTSGRPFAEGQAREWLLGLVPALGGDRRGNYIAMMNYMPLFLTMDPASTREAMAAIQELIAAENEKNPDRRRNPNGDGKLDTLLTLTLLRMAQTAPEAAMEIMKRNFDHEDGSARLLFFGRLTEDDPAKAEQLALSLENKQRREALEAVMYAMMNKNPQEALALAARHPGEVSGKAQEKILEEWAKRDPLPAMAAAVTEMEKSGNSELVRQSLEEWMKKDPAAAARWAAEHAGTGSVTARAMVLEGQLRDNPQAVLQEYNTLLEVGGAPGELDRLTGKLAETFARKDVPAAREWAEALPEGESRNRALREVAEEWVKTDAPGASEWIRALPQGALRDHAAGELTGSLAGQDPASAFQWGQSIADAKLRERALRGVIEKWREQDPGAAKAAAESAGLK